MRVNFALSLSSPLQIFFTKSAAVVVAVPFLLLRVHSTCVCLPVFLSKVCMCFCVYVCEIESNRQSERARAALKLLLLFLLLLFRFVLGRQNTKTKTKQKNNGEKTI